MFAAKALQWIIRYERLERLRLPSHTFVRDAVSLQVCRIEGQQIPAPFSLQVPDDRPQPIERIEHLAALRARVICRLPLVPILETEKPGCGKQRQKHRAPQDQRTRKPP